MNFKKILALLFLITLTTTLAFGCDSESRDVKNYQKSIQQEMSLIETNYNSLQNETSQTKLYASIDEIILSINAISALTAPETLRPLAIELNENLASLSQGLLTLKEGSVNSDSVMMQDASSTIETAISNINTIVPKIMAL